MSLIILKKSTSQSGNPVFGTFTNSNRIDHPISDEPGNIFFELTAVTGGSKYLCKYISCRSPIGSMHKQGFQPNRIGNHLNNFATSSLTQVIKNII